MSAWVPPDGTWAVPREAVAVLAATEAEATPYGRIFAPVSPALLAPKCQLGPENLSRSHPLGKLSLPLFSSYPLAAANTDDTNAAATPFVVDAASFAGGPVWNADFRPPSRGVPAAALAPRGPAPAAAGAPAAAAPSAATAAGGVGPSPSGVRAGAAAGQSPLPAAAAHEWAAVSVHPAGRAANTVNTVVAGPGAVQLWAMPHAAASDLCPQGLPRCVAQLAHDGAVCWDLKWCPAPGCIWGPAARAAAAAAASSSAAAPAASPSSSSSLPVLGLLAMVLGDGSVVVAAVPDPTALMDPAALMQPQQLHGGSSSGGGSGGGSSGGGGGAGAAVAAGAELQAAGGAAAGGMDEGAAGAIVPVPTPAATADAANGDGARQPVGPAATGEGGEGGDAGEGDELEQLSATAPPSPPALLRLLRPAVVLRAREHLGGAMPSCCDWHLPDPAGARGAGGAPGAPSPPALLLGCWDGSVALWRLPRAEALERQQLLFHVQADHPLALRAVVSNPVWDSDWLAAGGAGGTGAAAGGTGAAAAGRGPGEGGAAPAGAAGEGAAAAGEGAAAAAGAAGEGAPTAAAAAAAVADRSALAALGCGLGGRGGGGGGPGGHLFATTGYSGHVKIWDDRDMGSGPVVDRVIHRSYIQGAAWTRRPAGMAVAAEDGCLRLLLLEPGPVLGADDGGGGLGVAAYGPQQRRGAPGQRGAQAENGVVGALWSLCYSPALHVLLYGGCDGLVGAAAWEFPTDTRYRRPHVPLVGLARDGPRLRLLGPADLRGLQSFYAGGNNFKKDTHRDRPGSRGAAALPQRPPDIIPDAAAAVYTVRAGFGAAAGVACGAVPQPEAEAGDAGGAGEGAGGGAGAGVANPAAAAARRRQQEAWLARKAAGPPPGGSAAPGWGVGPAGAPVPPGYTANGKKRGRPPKPRPRGAPPARQRKGGAGKAAAAAKGEQAEEGEEAEEEEQEAEAADGEPAAKRRAAPGKKQQAEAAAAAVAAAVAEAAAGGGRTERAAKAQARARSQAQAAQEQAGKDEGKAKARAKGKGKGNKGGSDDDDDDGADSDFEAKEQGGSGSSSGGDDDDDGVVVSEEEEPEPEEEPEASEEEEEAAGGRGRGGRGRGRGQGRGRGRGAVDPASTPGEATASAMGRKKGAGPEAAAAAAAISGGEESDEGGGTGIGTGAGGGREPRKRGEYGPRGGGGSAAGGSSQEYVPGELEGPSEGVVGGSGSAGDPVWVLVGWRCGVMRCLRLSL